MRTCQIMMTGNALVAATVLATVSASASAADGIAAEDLSALCAFSDGQALEPTKITRFSDGGALYRFSDADGSGETVLPDPPPGFRPEAASDGMLSRYGFPARPTTPIDLAEWELDMATYVYTPLPVLCDGEAPPSSAGPAEEYTFSDVQLRGGPDVIDTYNWAGVLADHPSGDYYISVSGEHDQPSAGSDGCASSEEVTWVGLGGWHSGGLLQAGTGLKNNGGKYAWYEYLGGADSVPIQPIDNLTVHASDHMHISVFYEPANNRANFYVLNETSGASRSIIKNGLGDAYYDGTSAEAIDERPKYPSGFARLKNFGHVGWSHAKAQRPDGTWVWLGNVSSPKTVKMWSSGDTLLAHPSGFSDGGFRDNWDHC